MDPGAVLPEAILTRNVNGLVSANACHNFQTIQSLISENYAGNPAKNCPPPAIAISNAPPRAHNVADDIYVNSNVL
jgi:hypothetical protein